MAFIKCKICGGDVEVQQGKTWGTCDYCGSRVTFPKDSTEQRVNLFNRADAFRRQNEFDKAISAYEKILEEDQTDAEAHWGAALSRFGIEYVENPVTFERKPTLHRLQTTSILADDDYKAAIENASDDETRKTYEQQAQEIADIQKKVLEQSEREDQYDIFLSYKETDENGERTRDSIIAFEIYTALTKEGYNVFYAKESLKGRLGDEYEPIIFSALRSSQVMILIGTKKEYFEAEWVRNEWTRYLDLMRQEKDKPQDEQIPRQLIPCYRDMDAYELPVELNMLQSMNMNSISFLQDLIPGVRKIMDGGNQFSYSVKTDETSRLLQRAMNQAELGDFGRADALAEKVLDTDPNNATAQMVKLLVQLKVNTPDELVKQKQPLTHNRLYIMACRNAKGTQKKRYESYNKKIIANLEAAEKQKNLDKVLTEIKKLEEREKKLSKDDDSGFRALSKAYILQADALDQMGTFGGADEKAKECRKHSEEINHDIETRISERQRRLEEELAKKRAVEAQAKREREEKEEAERQARLAAEKAEQERLEKIRRRKAHNRLATFLAILAFAGAITVYKMYFENKLAYGAAVDTIEQSEKVSQLDYAESIMNQLGDAYEDVPTRIQQISADRQFIMMQKRQAYADYMSLDEKYRTTGKLAWYQDQYNHGQSLINSQKFDDAIQLYQSIDYYGDSKDQIKRAYSLKGDNAFTFGQYNAALVAYSAADGYQDTEMKIEQTKAAMQFDRGDYAGAYTAYKTLGGSYFTNIHQAWYDQQYENAKNYLESGEYQKAIEAFEAISYYNEDGKSAAEQLQNAHYSLAAQSKDAALAREHYELAAGYRDSDSLIRQIDADELFEREQYADAYELYASMDAKYQTYRDVYAGWFDAANKAMTEEGNIQQAISGFEQILYMDSQDFPVRQRLSTAYMTYAGSLLKPTGVIDESAVNEAIEYFELAGSDSSDAVWQYYYETGKLALQNDDTEMAIEAFNHINWEQDTRQLMGDYYYMLGQAALENHDIDAAKSAFSNAEGHDDCEELINAYYYQIGSEALEKGKVADAISAFTLASGYLDADEIITSLKAYERAGALLKSQKPLEAMQAYIEAGNCLDAPNMAQRCGQLAYDNAMKARTADRIILLEQLGDFSDAPSQIQAIKDNYNNAQLAYAAQNYEEAISLFELLDNYSDSENMLKNSQLGLARSLIDKRQYLEGIKILKELDSDDLDENELQNAQTAYALSLADEGKDYHALALLRTLNNTEDDDANYNTVLEKAVSALSDSDSVTKTYEKLKSEPDTDKSVIYELALAAEKSGAVDEALKILNDLGDYADSHTLYLELAYQQGISRSKAYDYQSAISYLELANGFKDAASQLNWSKYQYAGELYLQERYQEALDIYKSLGDYVNSRKYADNCRIKIDEALAGNQPGE